MAIPEGYDFYTWTNSQVGKLSTMASDLYVFKKYWGSLTAPQQTAIKNLLKTRIDEVRAELLLIKTEIDAV